MRFSFTNHEMSVHRKKPNTCICMQN